MNHFIKKRVRFTFYGSFYYDDELSRGWNFHMQAATTTCLFAVIYIYTLVWRKQCQDLSWTEKSTPKQFYWLKLAFELGFYNWPLAVNVLLLVLSNTIECFGSTHPRSQLGAVNPRKKQKKIRRSLQVVMLAIRICQREGAKWKSPRRKEKKIIC